MALRTNGLNWLAKNAGVGNCFAQSGINYRDVDGVFHTGGTKDVVNAFVVADMVEDRTATIIAGTNYNGFKSINDGVDLSMNDVKEAADREIDGGTYPKYCIATVQPPSGDAKPTTEPLEVYVGGGTDCAAGAPAVTLDTRAAFAFFKSDPYNYVGVGGIEVHNKNPTCRAHFAWEMKLWDGYGFVTCPATTPELVEINRYLAAAGGRPLSTKMLGASETDVVWGSFEVLPTTSGEKTICLSLWGNFDKAALIKELNDAGYFDKS